ncbi:hypothetical protein Tco_0245401 [Tanacetum coccineum]
MNMCNHTRTHLEPSDTTTTTGKSFRTSSGYKILAFRCKQAEDSSGLALTGGKADQNLRFPEAYAIDLGSTKVKKMAYKHCPQGGNQET